MRGFASARGLLFAALFGIWIVLPEGSLGAQSDDAGGATIPGEVTSEASSQSDEAGGATLPEEVTSGASSQFESQGVRLQRASPATLFEEGNRLYQESDFAGAVNAYESVLSAGLESSDLYYNLANAYFKRGMLGRAILNYERALRLRPRDPDVRANLDLARSLTADEIDPLPRFWLFSLGSWWVSLLPKGALRIVVALTYLLVAGGLCLRILSRQEEAPRVGTWILAGSGVALLIFGVTLLAREEVLGGTEWGIILVEEVAVQSAPSEDDDLTLFHIHEGTKVRLDQRTADWSEVVLEDGRVGWVPSGGLEAVNHTGVR
jgi:hypothetical protein